MTRFLIPKLGLSADRSDGLAVLVGGGVNVTMNRHLALRGLDANWLRTELPNGNSNIQKNLRLGAGVILRFP
jgi:hypothetical protein